LGSFDFSGLVRRCAGFVCAGGMPHGQALGEAIEFAELLAKLQEFGLEFAHQPDKLIAGANERRQQRDGHNNKEDDEDSNQSFHPPASASYSETTNIVFARVGFDTRRQR